MAAYTYERKIQYYETDQMGIVHHSNYIRWMEEARIAILGEIGLPYDKMEEEGILIPVLTASCEYRLAFRFGDIFVVSMEPMEFNGVKLKISYKITHKETGALHAKGETSHCFTDKNMKLLRLKKEYPDIYDGLLKWSTEG